MSDATSSQEFLKHQTGKIAKGAYCDCCGRYNARHMVVNVILVKGNEILLIQRDIEPNKGHWALPGGYLDWDETVEAAAIRETKEETGLDITGKLELVAIRSDKSAGLELQNVDMFFSTDQFSGTVAAEPGEIQVIRWAAVTELPELAFDQRAIIDEVFSRQQTDVRQPKVYLR